MWRLHYWVPPTYNLQRWVPLLSWLIIWLTKVFGGITIVYSSWLHFFPWHALLTPDGNSTWKVVHPRWPGFECWIKMTTCGATVCIYFFRHGRCCKHHTYPTEKNNPAIFIFYPLLRIPTAIASMDEGNVYSRDVYGNISIDAAKVTPRMWQLWVVRKKTSL